MGWLTREALDCGERHDGGVSVKESTGGHMVRPAVTPTHGSNNRVEQKVSLCVVCVCLCLCVSVCFAFSFRFLHLNPRARLFASAPPRHAVALDLSRTFGWPDAGHAGCSPNQKESTSEATGGRPSPAR